MRITCFRIENFKNIRLVECSDPPDFMVVCGGNGCPQERLSIGSNAGEGSLRGLRRRLRLPAELDFGRRLRVSNPFDSTIRRSRTHVSEKQGSAGRSQSAREKILILPDGKLLLAGPIGGMIVAAGFSFGKIRADGTPDRAFHEQEGFLDMGPIVLQGDKISTVDPDVRLVRLNADGTPDARFHPAPLRVYSK